MLIPGYILLKKSKLEKKIQAGNVFQYSMHPQAEYFNEDRINEYALSDLTMILNPDFEVGNSLKNKLKITTWTTAMS